MNTELYKLTDLIDLDLAENKYSNVEKIELAKKIKPLISDNSIVIAQANPVCGNLKYNTTKAKKWIEWANLLEIKTIIFPELFLIGNPVGDYLLRFPSIAEECKEWLEALAKFTGDTKVLIGFIDYDNSAEEKTYYNAVGILQNEKIEKVIRKSVLSATPELNENKYFIEDKNNFKNRIISIEDKNFGIVIGENLRNIAEKEYETLIQTLVQTQKIDALINCSSSISRTGKENYKNSKLSNISKQNNIPFIYVNQSGSSDNLSFDGASLVFDKTGKLIYRAKSFKEQFFVVNPFDNEGKLYPSLTSEVKNNQISQNKFSLDYQYDLKRTYETIIQSIRDYFRKTGFKHACLGLSGGLDSTVCAVLLADALGKENVFGISMPSKITSTTSKNDARDLAKNLGINFLEIPIKNIYESVRDTFDDLFKEMENKWEFRYKQSYTNDNIQARTRATILWGVANEFEKCLTIATSDKSEAYMGYATVNGDMSGGYAPIADVTKTKLFALAKWMNENREVKNAIPQSIIEKRPGAELAINPKTGKPLLAEEALMPYEFLDEIIWRIENLNQSVNDMIDSEFVYEKTTNVSKEQKSEWLEKFFRRMSFAAYKWSIMAPAPIVDAHSINGAEFHQQIIASGINYKKTDLDYKINSLN